MLAAALVLATPAAAQEPRSPRASGRPDLDPAPDHARLRRAHVNFPEESATYWLARFRLPAGARVVLRGGYPHGRYMSLNAYTRGAPAERSPTSRRAGRRGVNPFVAGARRDRPRRAWKVTVVDEPMPAEGARGEHDLRAAEPARRSSSPTASTSPTAGRDLTGDTGLPAAEVVLGDGRVLAAGRRATAINDANRDITVQTGARRAVARGDALPPRPPGVRPRPLGALLQPRLRDGVVLADCTEAGFAARRHAPAEQQGGFYSNRDTAYVFTHLAGLGRGGRRAGALPVFPRTAPASRGWAPAQLRFWSLCPASRRHHAHARLPRRPPGAARRGPRVHDRGLQARPTGRPTRGACCGVGWLDWGERGDGAGRPDYGLLIMRNMLVSPDFAQAIQRVPRPGAEPATMGPYFPPVPTRRRRRSSARLPARRCAARRRALPAAPRGADARRERLRSAAVYAGRRRIAFRRGRGARRLVLTVPSTKASRLRVVLTTTHGRKVRSVRRAPRCRRERARCVRPASLKTDAKSSARRGRYGAIGRVGAARARKGSLMGSIIHGARNTPAFLAAVASAVVLLALLLVPRRRTPRRSGSAEAPSPSRRTGVAGIGVTNPNPWR